MICVAAWINIRIVQYEKRREEKNEKKKRKNTGDDETASMRNIFAYRELGAISFRECVGVLEKFKSEAMFAKRRQKNETFSSLSSEQFRARWIEWSRQRGEEENRLKHAFHVLYTSIIIIYKPSKSIMNIMIFPE